MKKLLALLVVLWSFVAIVFVAITTIGLVKGEKLGHPRPSPGQSYAVTVQGTRLFLSERDGRFIAFVDDAHHMGQERLWWCPVERVFAAPTHGEMFDADGSYLAGPATRDLDRVAVSEYGDGSLLVAGWVEEGRSRPLGGEHLDGLEPRLRDLAEAGWGGPGFCAGHVSTRG